MRIIIVDSYDEMSRKAAAIVKSQVILKPESVIGCATGETPLGMYQELVKSYRNREVDFTDTIFFNLDEYCHVAGDSPHSYRHYMNKNFFNQVNAQKHNIFIPDGMTRDFKKECKRYDDQIKAKGGIDLQLLGIGENGHIGFNEPGESFETETHVVRLQENTIEANSRYFPSKDLVPDSAITMGIESIMHSKRLLMLANGEDKADAIYKAIKGDVSPRVPASIIQLHPNTILIIEKSAAALLRG